MTGTAHYVKNALIPGVTGIELLESAADILEQQWRLRRLRRDPGAVVARTKISFLSWGDDIRVEVTSEASQSAAVVICKPVGYQDNYYRLGSESPQRGAIAFRASSTDYVNQLKRPTRQREGNSAALYSVVLLVQRGVSAASAPSATRTRDLLLRRHNRPSALQTSNDVRHQRAKQLKGSCSRGALRWEPASRSGPVDSRGWQRCPG